VSTLLRSCGFFRRVHETVGNAVSGSAVWPFNVVNEAHPDVPVDRAPVGQDVHSVTGRVRFACADFQRSRAHWARGRGSRQLHDCLHASQQPDPARATQRESMSGRASHRSSKKYTCLEIIENKLFSLFVQIQRGARVRGNRPSSRKLRSAIPWISTWIASLSESDRLRI
jgi:hypothetical protein